MEISLRKSFYSTILFTLVSRDNQRVKDVIINTINNYFVLMIRDYGFRNDGFNRFSK